MKESVKPNYGDVLEKLQEYALEILTHLALAVIGFLTSRASMVQSMAPLGLALTCGMPKYYTISVGIGAFIGYLIPVFGGGAFRYIASIFAIICIKLIVSNIKNIANTPAWSGVIAFAATASTGMVAAGSSFFPNGVMAVAEAAIAGGGAYFVHRAMKHNYNDKTGLSNEELASLLILVYIVLAGLYPVAFGGISVGKMIGIVLIFTAARFGNTGAGTICGVSSGISVLLSGMGALPAFIYSAGGLAAGMFAPMGKIAMVLGFSAVSMLAVIFSGFDSDSVIILVEVLCSGAIFLLLPKALSSKIGAVFSPPANIENLDGLRKALVMRLDFASEAMHGVSSTVEEVSKRLSSHKQPDFASVLLNVEGDACKGCMFGVNCWENNRSDTIEAMISMTTAIKKGQPIDLAEVPHSFAERCLRRERVENSLYHYFTDYAAGIAAESRIREMREVVSDQFEGISEMLADLSVEFESAQQYDVLTAERIVASLKELDIRASDCGCSIDKYGRMSIEVRLREQPSLPFNRLRVLNKIEEVCDREFDPPAINKVGNEYFITLSEKAVFSADCGTAQYNCKENKMCGDAADCFYDGRGRLVMIISDGMGSGGRAAVDGAMAAGLMGRLIKSGFGYDCSLRIVNSAMLFKSTDESLATVDIACVDLFTGMTELLKAGAAPTFVRRNGRTGKAECHSLPAGILKDVGFDRAVVTIKENDIVLMLSDGAVNDGTDWICAELEAWRDGSAQQLADHIAAAARRRRTDGHDDDITVMATILEKAV